MKALFLGIAAALLLGSPQGMADELKVLSAGAMQRGLVTVAAKFKEQSGDQVQIRYATAPELKKIFSEAGAPADVILAPNPTLADLAKAGKVSPDTQKEIGGVGSAVLIRLDAPVPDVSNLAAFKRSLTEADALVYNRASSGTYIDSMLKKIGVFDQIERKLVRLWDGTAVMHHLLEGKGKEFGFGGITDILGYRDRGLRLVGPLPAEIQNYANYSAAVLAAAPDAEGARAFLTYLASPDGRALFVANGIPE